MPTPMNERIAKLRAFHVARCMTAWSDVGYATLLAECDNSPRRALKRLRETPQAQHAPQLTARRAVRQAVVAAAAGSAHRRVYSEHEHLSRSYTPIVLAATNSSGQRTTVNATRYVKPGETQQHAVKRFMEMLRRRWVAPEQRTYPAWTPGQSVKDYVTTFRNLNRVARVLDYGENDAALSTRPQELVDDTPQVEAVE